MKTMFCWRCQMDIPMLDEAEYKVIAELHSQGLRAIKQFREQKNVSLSEVSTEEYFRPLLQKYEEITGFKETVANAIMHHRILLYGAPCENCGKPLRSPQAVMCAACGKKKDA